MVSCKGLRFVLLQVSRAMRGSVSVALGREEYARSCVRVAQIVGAYWRWHGRVSMTKSILNGGKL